jgi:ammonia channel protein AmtB
VKEYPTWHAVRSGFLFRPKNRMLLQAKGVLIVTGLFYGGVVNQLVMQIIYLAALVTGAFTVMFIWMKVSNLVIPIRPPSEIELQVLNATQMRRLPISTSHLRSKSGRYS